MRRTASTIAMLLGFITTTASANNCDEASQRAYSACLERSRCALLPVEDGKRCYAICKGEADGVKRRCQLSPAR